MACMKSRVWIGIYSLYNVTTKLPWRPCRRTQLPIGELFDQLLAEIKEFALGQDFLDDVCLVGMEMAEVDK